VTLYIYDSYGGNCPSEESFQLTITLPLSCTNLNSPTNGSIDIFVNSELSWDVVPEATGYLLSVGTTPSGNNILNMLDVGNTLSYAFSNDLPYNTEIFVSVVPYNDNEIAVICTMESFTTERKELPPSYFTPNGDSYNDVWIIPDRDNRISKVYIYDRFGKMLSTLIGSTFIWDGNYNGQLMPADDYWYTVEYKDGKFLKGHFSLVR